MLEAFSTPRNVIRTLILLAVCGLLAVAAGVLGIADNPPGLLSAFLSAGAFFLAFTHPWRTSRQFLHLLYASGLGIVVFAVLHNVFEAMAWRLSDSSLLHGFLGGLGGVFFLIAILVCPPGLLVGAIGAGVMSARKRNQPPPVRWNG